MIFTVTFEVLVGYQMIAGPNITDFGIRVIFIWYFIVIVIFQVAVLLQRHKFLDLLACIFKQSYLSKFSETEQTLIVFYYVLLIVGVILSKTKVTYSPLV